MQFSDKSISNSKKLNKIQKRESHDRLTVITTTIYFHERCQSSWFEMTAQNKSFVSRLYGIGVVFS